jgi:hypothetical protein
MTGRKQRRNCGNDVNEDQNTARRTGIIPDFMQKFTYIPNAARISGVRDGLIAYRACARKFAETPFHPPRMGRTGPPSA